MRIQVFLGLLALLLWALSTMGLLYRLAKARGRSNHWMWWGIHPLIGLIALLILYKKPPTSTAPFVRTARPCPRCQSTNVTGAMPREVELKKRGLPTFTVLGYQSCQACGQIWERRAPLWTWYLGVTIGVGLCGAPLAYAWGRPYTFGLGITVCLGLSVLVGSIRGLLRARKASIDG